VSIWNGELAGSKLTCGFPTGAGPAWVGVRHGVVNRDGVGVVSRVEVSRRGCEGEFCCLSD
jgi:hypothetical protein